MSNQIEINHLSKSWKDFSLQDIHLTLEPGYIMGLIGRNGAGKTTLMDCILGKNNYEGQIIICGKDLASDRVGALNEVGFITEPGPFAPQKSLTDNGLLLGCLYDNFNMEEFSSLLCRFGLSSTKKYCELSKGMKTRFQLAFALSHHPSLLVMDEPTGGLDPVFRKEFLYQIQEEVKNSMTSVIISTHLTQDLDKVADYIYMIDEGREVFHLDKETMAEQYPVISGRIEDYREELLETHGRVRKAQGTFTTMLKEPSQLIKVRNAVDSGLNYQIERTNIEDIMYYLTSPVLKLNGEEENE